MFPAPPLPKGGDLNVIEHRATDDLRQPVFGPHTVASQRIAYDIKQPTPSDDIAALFSLIEEQQARSTSSFSSQAASSAPVAAPIAEELDLPDDPPPEIQPPARPKKRGTGGKASASKTKSPTSVVKETSTDF